MRVLRTSLAARVKQEAKRVSDHDDRDNADDHKPSRRISNR